MCFNLLEINGICKKYKDKSILENISFVVDRGEVVSIIGKNGSGKSTLLSIMAGILLADSGAVNYNGQTVGFVPQSDYLFDDLTVKDNIKFWAAANKVKIHKLEDNQFVRLLDLAEFQNKKISSLSGGMKRRTTICVSLLSNPDILILDEPFAGLDLYYKSELIQYLNLLKNLKKTIIYTSHSADEIVYLSTKIYVINNAKLVFVANTSQFLSSEFRSDDKDSKGEDLNKVLLKYIKGEM